MLVADGGELTRRDVDQPRPRGLIVGPAASLHSVLLNGRVASGMAIVANAMS